MGYFDYIAKQSFKSAPSGKRVFYRGGPWSRPYLVPDQATEQRLYIRQLWLMRLLLGVLILGQPFLFLLVPEVIREPLWFLGYLIAVAVVSGVAGHLLFRGPLRGLQRAPSRLPIRAFYAEMAHRHSALALALGLLGSLAFIASGAGMLLAGHNSVIAWICIGFFGLAAFPWGYALWLKLRVVSTPE